MAPEIGGRVHGNDGLKAERPVAGDRRELGEKGEIDGARKLENIVLVDAEHLHQEIARFSVALLEDLQTDRAAALPLFDGFLDLNEQILRFLVDLQIGISGEPERAAGLDFMQLEQLLHFINDDVFQQHKGAPILGGKLEEAGEDGRDLNDGEARAVVILEMDSDIQAFIGKHRKGTAAVHRQRGEDREQHLVKIIGDKLPLLIVHFVRGEKIKPLTAQHRQDGAVQAGILLFHKGADFFGQLRQKLGGCQAGGIRRAVFGAHLLLDACHAHHEEFVQVGRGDGEETQTLHDGIIAVGSLLQNAGIEVHPAQFPVQVGEFRGGVCMAHVLSRLS